MYQLPSTSLLLAVFIWPFGSGGATRPLANSARGSYYRWVNDYTHSSYHTNKALSYTNLACLFLLTRLGVYRFNDILSPVPTLAAVPVFVRARAPVAVYGSSGAGGSVGAPRRDDAI